MRLGSKVLLITLFLFNFLQAEQKITTTPLINIDKIKPSFENLDLKENTTSSKKLKEKKIRNLNSSQAVLIGLDKITAKSTELIMNLNESTKGLHLYYF